MKKILATMVVLAISQMMSAQNLIGTWKSTYKDDRQRTHYLVFSKPNKVQETIIWNVFTVLTEQTRVLSADGYYYVYPTCPIAETQTGTYRVEKNRWGDTIIFLNMLGYSNNLGKIEYPDGYPENMKKKALDEGRSYADLAQMIQRNIKDQKSYKCEFIDANTFKIGNKTFERETNK